MGIVILLVMIGVPIVEIAVFVEVGGYIGLWPTLATVVLTAVIGTTLLRLQGLATLYRAQQSLNDGRFPVAEVYDGVCLLVAGVLLLTPGFVTDAVGFALFVPAVRRGLQHLIGRYLLSSGRVHVWPPQGGMGGGAPSDGAGADDRRPGATTVIEGEFEEIRDDPEDQNDRNDQSRRSGG